MGRGIIWKDAETDILLNTIAKHLPVTQEDWIRCENDFNQGMEEAKKRSAETMKRKFISLRNIKKPTGSVQLHSRIKRAKDIYGYLKIKYDTTRVDERQSSVSDEGDDEQENQTTLQVEPSDGVQEIHIEPTRSSLSRSASLSTESSMENNHNTGPDVDVGPNPTPVHNSMKTRRVCTPGAPANLTSRERRKRQAPVSANKTGIPPQKLGSKTQISTENMSTSSNIRKRRNSDRILQAVENINSQLVELKTNVLDHVRYAEKSRLDLKEKQFQMEAEYRRQALDMQRQTLEITRLDREERRRQEDRMTQDQREEREERYRRDREEREERREEREERRREQRQAEEMNKLFLINLFKRSNDQDM